MYMSLLSQVSVNEMMEMRENEGMSNREIAEALGTTVTTVRKYIGNQPKGMRKVRSNGVIFHPSLREKPEPIVEEPSHAMLVMANRILDLVGINFEYTINCAEKKVCVRRVEGHEIVIEFTLEELHEISSSLSCIAKKIDSLKIAPEMW